MVALSFIFLLLVASTKAKENKKPRRIQRVTPCGCRHKGVLYDLSKLANSNGSARFTIGSAEKDNFYSYNPCIPFTIPSKISIPYHCNNVAICYWSKDGQRRVPLGYQLPGQIQCEISTENIISLVYLQGGQGRLLNYTATIEMVCNRTKKSPEEATMTLKPGQSALPVFQVSHQCCCREGCAAMCSNPEPSDMIYYEIGTAVGGVVFTFVAGFIGFMIAKKKYRGNDPILPPPFRNVGYGAANQQERPGGQGAGGGNGVGYVGGGGGGVPDHRRSLDSFTDSDGNVSDSDYNHSVAGDSNSRYAIPSENDDISC